jgi:hypothetical protein
MGEVQPKDLFVRFSMSGEVCGSELAKTDAVPCPKPLPNNTPAFSEWMLEGKKFEP